MPVSRVVDAVAADMLPMSANIVYLAGESFISFSPGASARYTLFSWNLT